VASFKAKNMAEAVDMTRKGVTQNIVLGGVYFVVSKKKGKQLQMQKVVVYEN